MSKILMFICFLSFTQSSFSQEKIINKSSKYKDSSILIFYYENEMKLPILPKGKFQIKTILSNVKSTSDPTLFILTTQRKGTDTLTIIQNGKVLLRQAFLIVEAEIIAQWGFLTSTTATTTEIILNRKMIATFKEFYTFPRHVIGNFKMSLITNQSGIADHDKSFTITGSEIDSHIIGLIKKMVKGDKIIFTDIRTIDIDSYPRKLPDFAITIRTAP